MGEDKILTAGLSDDARICFITMDVLPNCLPNILENTCRACEVNTCKIRVLENNIAGIWSRDVNQIDDPIRKSCFLENLNQHIGRINLCIRWLLHDNITYHSYARRYISGDCRKVEWRQGKYEAFQRTLLYVIPHTFAIRWRLLLVDFGHVLHIEAQEIDNLTSRINLRLVGTLGLSQHGSRIKFIAVFRSDQLCRLQEYGCTLLPGKVFPLFFGRKSRIDGILDMLFRALGIVP